MSAEQSSKIVELNPLDVLPSGKNRGRWEKGVPNQDEVAKIAISMLTDGQIQPVEFREEGKKKIIVAGETRRQAAAMICEGFVYNTQSFQPQPEFKLRGVKVNQADDETAFRRAVSENLRRNATTVVDDAFNMLHMKQELHMKQRAIADLYGCDPAHVSRVLKLVKLDDATLLKVHTGELSFNSAVELVDIPADKRQEVLQATNGKLSAVRDEVREVKIEAKKEEVKADVIHDIAGPTATEADLTPEQKTAVEAVVQATVSPPVTATTPAQPKPVKSTDRTASQMKDMLKDYITEDTGEVVRVITAVYYAYLTGSINRMQVEEKIKAMGQ